MPTREDYINRLSQTYGDPETFGARMSLSNGEYAYLGQPEDHGFLGNKARVFGGSAVSAIGDILTTAGVYGKKAGSTLPEDDIGAMVADIAGDSLLNNGQYLINKGSEWIGNYAQNEKWENKDLWDRATTPEYWTDPNGFLTDTLIMGGSMVPTVALAAAMPEVGGARLVGGSL